MIEQLDSVCANVVSSGVPSRSSNSRTKEAGTGAPPHIPSLTEARSLAAAGVRPRRAALTGPDALTSAERQVAGLAAAGRSNKQIAQHLFITTGTVETHLRHVFQKLDIASRADIPETIAWAVPTS